MQGSINETETLVIIKTTAFPALQHCSPSGSVSSHFRNSNPARAMIGQLNSAQRYLAQKYAFHVVDLEAMVSAFGDHKVYLRDEHHPTKAFSIELFNIFLNMLQHKRAQQVPTIA